MSREVAAGENIVLYCEFYTIESDNKVLRDPDTTPVVSIYDPLHDPRDSGVSGSDAIIFQASTTRVTTGIYKYTYTAPSGVDTNWYFDKWETTFEGIDGQAIMQFLVMGTDTGSSPLTNNLLVTVTLSADIADLDGNTLGEPYEFWFTTEFSPMYSDPTLVRLNAGPIVKDISDETLTLMLYESSLLADDITPTGITLTSRYPNARTRFVTLDAILRLLVLPINTGKMQKSLGDLMVSRDSNIASAIDRISKDRDDYYRIVNSGGNIGLGESFGPISTVKGLYDPDRRNAGRLWIVPGPYDISGANSRIYYENQRLKKYYLTPGSSRSSKYEDYN